MQIDFCRDAQGLKSNLAVGSHEIRPFCFLLVFLFTHGSLFVRNYQLYLPPKILNHL